MIDVKISMASNGKNLTLKNFYSKNENSNINYHINSQISKADMWLIFEDLKNETETCDVPKNKIFYLNNETSFRKDYFFESHMVKFLSQFSKAFGCYATSNENYVSTPLWLPWMIHANHGDQIFEDSNLNFDYFSNLNNLEKSIDLSVICSNKSHTENHSLRFEFVKILKNHFGERLHWYGNGINTIEKKSDIIFKSKYHIAIENDSRHNLVSEKLYDSFLGLSFPIYYGAPNISELFDKDSLISINITDVNNSIKLIESVLKSNLYQKNFNQLLKSKDQVLNDFNIYYRLNKLVEENILNKPTSSEIITIHSSNYFWRKTVSNKKKIKRIVKRKLRIN
tara:strand:+ start:7301 stop:8317 length:1017 start_codon:yes stop_codon:yes gene_type:complete